MQSALPRVAVRDRLRESVRYRDSVLNVGLLEDRDQEGSGRFAVLFLVVDRVVPTPDNTSFRSPNLHLIIEPFMTS